MAGHSVADYQTSPSPILEQLNAADAPHVIAEMMKMRVSFKPVEEKNANMKLVHRIYLEFELIINGEWTHQLT